MADRRVLADFEGRWRLMREITPAEGPNGRFEGEAVWQAQGGGLAYREAGVLHLGGATPMQAERAYSWDTDLNVYFDDGRFFHQVPAGGGDAAHWCDPDQYDVSYDFSAWPRFSARWRVKGPRKDYVMQSDYTFLR